MTKGIFIGRFQPFHKGHLDALKQILQEVDSVTILIGSSNKKRTTDNPLSFSERKKYLRSVLPFKKYHILPIPDVPSDKNWIKGILQKVGSFDAFYLTDNAWVEKILRQHQLPYKKTKRRITVSATQIRTWIRQRDKTFRSYLVQPLPLTLLRIIERT